MMLYDLRLMSYTRHGMGLSVLLLSERVFLSMMAFLLPSRASFYNMGFDTCGSLGPCAAVIYTSGEPTPPPQGT